MSSTTNETTYIKIEYGERLDVEVLSNYLKALNKEFKYYLKENHLEETYSDSLYIKEIKSGCIEIIPVLQMLAGATIPFLPELGVNSVLFDYFKTIVKNLRSFNMPDNVSLNFNNNRVLNNSQLNFLGVHVSNITYNGYVNNEPQKIEQPCGEQAVAIKENIEKELQNREKLLTQSYISMPFYWDNAKFSNSTSSYYKGKIDKISNKALQVIWESDTDRKFMTEESHLNKPWQELYYVVDVEVIAVNDTYCYKILKVHEQQTFTN